MIAGATNIYNPTNVNLSDIAAITALSSVLYDNRNINLSISSLAGMDASVEYKTNIISAGTQLSRLFHYDQQATASDPLVSILNTVAHPVGVRTRSWFGLTEGSASGQLGVNFTGSYSNPTAMPPARVSSWTTFDLALAYDFTEQYRVLHGFRVSVVVRNLLDKSPPYVGISTSSSAGVIENIGYDPVNADPTGRFIGLEFSKRWGRQTPGTH